MDLDFMVMMDAADLDRLGARMARQGFTGDEQWRRWEQHSYWFVSAEDLVLQKLKVGRPRDFEDAAGVLRP